jgi:hypothetical protein
MAGASSQRRYALSLRLDLSTPNDTYAHAKRAGPPNECACPSSFHRQSPSQNGWGSVPRGPVSRILYPSGAGMMVISLAPPLPKGSCSQPGGPAGHRRSAKRSTPPYLALLQVGFTSDPCHHGTWCALAAPFHPCLCPNGVGTIGGLVSVALAVASRRLGVTQHPARWSPDFPLRRTGATTRTPRQHHYTADAASPSGRGWVFRSVTCASSSPTVIRETKVRNTSWRWATLNESHSSSRRRWAC